MARSNGSQIQRDTLGSHPRKKDIAYTTSGSGSNTRGPLVKLSKNVVTPKVETSRETPKSSAMGSVAAV